MQARGRQCIAPALNNVSTRAVAPSYDRYGSETHWITRVGGDTAALEPGHVGVSKGILGQTRESRHVDSAGVDSRPLLQDTTSFRALKHAV